MKKKRKTLWDRFSSCYLVLILLFIYLPIFYVILFSFNESKSLSNFTGFSLKWYENMFQDRTMLQSIYYTVIVAVIATVVSTVVGTVAAIGLSKSKKVIRTLVLEVNNLPVMNPDIVTAIGLMLLFISMKVQLSLVTLILSHITFCIPYVILSVMPKLKQMNKHTYEAALDLGATPTYALTHVIIPECRQGIVTGAMLAFTLSLDDFTISYFTTSPIVQNLSTLIYSAARRGIEPTLNALSALMFVALLVLLLIVNRRTAEQ